MNRYQDKEILLKILECSKADVYIFFLNFLLTTKQPLLPMLQSVSHSNFIESFESYLLDSIYTDTELLLKLVDFNVITRTQMRAIETKRTSLKRHKELLCIISQTSLKSFDLFLSALVHSSQSSILENMRLIYSESDKPETSSAIKQVEMVVETVPETQSNSMLDFDKTPPNVRDISPREDWTYSDELTQPIGYEEDLVFDYTLERKSCFDLLLLKKMQPLSYVTSGIFKAIKLLPDDIQNILLLKEEAIGKRPEVDVHSLSHMTFILGYLSNTSEQIYDREMQCPYNTALGNLSIVIKSDKVDRMEELKMRAVVKSLYDKLITRTDPSGDVLETLVEYGVLTWQHMNDVKALPSFKSRSDKLYSILSAKKHYNACLARETVERSVVKMANLAIDLPLNSDMELFTDGRQLSVANKRANQLDKDDFSEDILTLCLHEMYPRIAASFDPKGYVLGSLSAKGTITNIERHQIGRLSEGRGAALLDILLTSGKPNAIEDFLEALFVSDEPAWTWIAVEVYNAAHEKVASMSMSGGASSVPMSQGREAFQSKQPDNH